MSAKKSWWPRDKEEETNRHRPIRLVVEICDKRCPTVEASSGSNYRCGEDGWFPKFHKYRQSGALISMAKSSLVVWSPLLRRVLSENEAQQFSALQQTLNSFFVTPKEDYSFACGPSPNGVFSAASFYSSLQPLQASNPNFARGQPLTSILDHTKEYSGRKDCHCVAIWVPHFSSPIGTTFSILSQVLSPSGELGPSLISILHHTKALTVLWSKRMPSCGNLGSSLFLSILSQALSPSGELGPSLTGQFEDKYRWILSWEPGTLRLLGQALGLPAEAIAILGGLKRKTTFTANTQTLLVEEDC
ncbi:hypothetical protein AMTR_s00156p00044450 [Amborella trichopoda]|uniref:Uncharacterized protein n=1 Tax=Amborella trichopoda TaxID=13333 RepID=W1PMB8_AMBTC|nr:hypothetical protein AMTR_s00156p00044450 [Amborella trichopoda]